jgi:predicted nucleic acid-binding protein
VGSDRGWIERDEHGNVTVHAPAARWPPPSDDSLHVYLDTCLVSGLAKRDLPPTEQKALRHLLLMHRAGRVSLMTSAVTKEELERLPGGVRELHEDIYALLGEVPISPEVVPLPVTNAQESRLVGVLPDVTLTELRQLVPDENDARHLVHALKAGCDFFVTTDQRTIISKRESVEARFSLKIRKPSELVAELSDGPG